MNLIVLISSKHCKQLSSNSDVKIISSNNGHLIISNLYTNQSNVISRLNGLIGLRLRGFVDKGWQRGISLKQLLLLQRLLMGGVASLGC